LTAFVKGIALQSICLDKVARRRIIFVIDAVFLARQVAESATLHCFAKHTLNTNA